MHLVHYKKGIKREDIGNVENSVVVVGIMIEVSLLTELSFTIFGVGETNNTLN